MQELFASGRAVDIVLAFMAVEVLWLIVLRRRKPMTVLLMVLPGAMMLLGLRAALTGVGWQWVALAITASLPLHLADLRNRRL